MESGFVAVSKQQIDTAEKTIVVFGAGRGGTSAVSGCLRELGVAMPNAHPFKHEWSPFVDGDLDFKSARAVISAIDAQHKVWGWKSPKDIFCIRGAVGIVRNIHAVIVVRHLLDICQSSEEKEGVPWDAVFQDAVAAYTEIGQIMSLAAFPIAVISYEKLVASPLPVIEELSTWLDLPVTEEMRQRAAEFVTGGKGYKTIAGDTSSAGISDKDLSADALLAQITIFSRRLQELLAATGFLKADSKEAENIIELLRSRISLLTTNLNLDPGLNTITSFDQMPLNSLIGFLELATGSSIFEEAKRITFKLQTLRPAVFASTRGYSFRLGSTDEAAMQRSHVLRTAYFDARREYSEAAIVRQKQQLNIDALLLIESTLKSYSNSAPVIAAEEVVDM